jgi:hypothetical protein
MNLNMPAQFIDRLKTILASSQSVSLLMRNISYLAIFISPLLLLHPKKFDQTSIRKDALIAVSPSFDFVDICLQVKMAATFISRKHATRTS